MASLVASRLYGILDTGYVAVDDLLPVARRMLEGGIDILQFRAKGFVPAEIERWALQLREIAVDTGVPLIINDYPEVAAAVEADGVHVGQDDLPLSDVRRLIPEGMLIGKSTHSLAQAVAAMDEKPDYIGFGPLFATPTKPDYVPIGTDDIIEVHRRVDIPVFCIGGIKKENLRSVLDSGARRVVIVSGILQARDIPGYISECRQLLQPDE